MKKIIYSTLLCFGGIWCFGQQDSIVISAKLSADAQTLLVNQSIVYHNPHQTSIDKVKLQNWVAAYQNRATPLLKRKLQDRKKELYFANADQLGQLNNLHISSPNNSKIYNQLKEEFIYFYLDRPLKPSESVTLNLQYEIKLPSAKFTGYGTNKNGINLKYFFIVPDSFEGENQYPKHFLDTEQNLNSESFWNVKFDIPFEAVAESNLPKVESNNFKGISINDPEFYITFNKNITKTTIDVGNQKVDLVFGYPLSTKDLQSIEFFAPLQLQFIKNRFGHLPEKIFLSEKFRGTEKFVGIDDLNFWKFHFEVFSDPEKVDINYFGYLSKQVINQLFVNEKNEDHWLKNGLQTYTELQYLKTYYPEHKLLGELPEKKILGMKPLKIFHASDVKLTERYPLIYQYILTQNLDQKINSDYEDLSKFNTEAISHFETGILFNFIADQLGYEKFDQFLHSYFTNNYGKRVDAQDFLDVLEKSSAGHSKFLKPLIEQKNRVNFNLKKFDRKENSFDVLVQQNTALTLPFKLQTETETGEQFTEWELADTKKKLYSIKTNDATKLLINDDFVFPETNFRDNYLYTKGLFSNMKKLKLKLIKDIPNPEYNELYLSPRISFNAYDKILLGINVINRGLFDQKFVYSVSPYYSTGTGELTGRAGVSYSFLPADSFFRSWQFGGGASYFHYDYDLSYQTYNFFSNLLFSKNPRSAVNRSLYFNYAHFEKDLDEKRILAKEYGKYNLWNIGYAYNNNAAIHERYFNTGFQWMEDFQKWSSEAFYRWEYAKNKKVSFRFFGGIFFTNKTQNDIFDYGISRVSNYAFSYGLLGQSATTGVLSQQFILAEGGFKSDFKAKANQWITSINVDAHLWKMFNIYADAGVYKSKGASSQFVWDSGVKLKIVPDFFEVYFPVQSSLGFEPAMKDYGYRIRYTLIFNLGALVSNLRRGVF